MTISHSPLNQFSPTYLNVWRELQHHYHQIADHSMKLWFCEDPQRGRRFSIESGGILLDYSKNRITEETLNLLVRLAIDSRLNTHMGDLFKQSYTKLREVSENNTDTWNKMKILVDQIRSGQHLGFDNKPLKNIVNIGIGGSIMGPQTVRYALEPYEDKALDFYYISNQDEAACHEVLRQVDPATTLFVVVSKSFQTKETLSNYARVKSWICQAVAKEIAMDKHFLAITAYPDRAKEQGFTESNIFTLPPWICGRFSIWSAVGLSTAIAIGWNNFYDFLSGARAMDNHFRNSNFNVNMPVILAILGIWYLNFFNIRTHAIIPYCYRLSFLPDYLKQMSMESQGKCTNREGYLIDYLAGSVICGGVGTDSQHSFHQLFLQGTHLSIIPIDFILPLRQLHHEFQMDLIADCLSQSEILMRGENAEITHCIVPGNNPSNTLIMQELTPYNLGALIALYEHKVYVQSVIWNINPFDQWGVECGKNLSRSMLNHLKQGIIPTHSDSSTQRLLDYIYSKHTIAETL